MLKSIEYKTEDNRYYHDTLTFLKRYRDIKWSLEVTAEAIKSKCNLKCDTGVSEILDSANQTDLSIFGDGIADRVVSIERTYTMVKLIDCSVNLIRQKHKNGEMYYLVLYYCFLSPHKYKNAEEIIEKLRPNVIDISYQTYYRKRKEAINLLSTILWGYSSRECNGLLGTFFS